ncbi:MAG: Pycsar system effector family protein [Novosphingobium sp.]
MAEPQSAEKFAAPREVPGPAVNAIHFVRTLQQITLNYSQMADHKASLLMGANFIVFTIAVGQVRKGGLPVSLTVLALFAFASAVCAILAVVPSIGRPRNGQIPDANKLFFGHFAHQREEDWIESMMPHLRADSDMYRVMLRDIYQNGRVLQRKKYRFLSIAYRIFLVGLCLTVVAFTMEMLGTFGDALTK